MSERLLDRIESPADLRELDPEQVEQVTRELRQEIVGTVSKTGGHLASSLGAVELLKKDDIPPKVAIQEAIRLAEAYGGEESPRFVNGVLDALYKGRPEGA